MIAKLTGVLDSTGDNWAVVDVAGVGYLVYCSARTLGALPQPGETVRFAVETHVREDHIHLYGFAEPAERDWFRLLTTVQGVGAKVALALLSVMAPDALADAVAAQDRAALTEAAGVGAKLAARILVELKDRVAAMVHKVDFGTAGAAGAAQSVNGPVPDAVSALVNLGFRRTDAYGAVAAAARSLGGEARIEALVRAGLKELSA
jgi:Holliday junction DNA helicase RuvA